MSDEFQYDVFLSHSVKDKAVVRDVAERLRKEGLPSASQPSTLNSQLSAGSDWAQLESGTFRFRDPLNKERRFLPLRLDDTPSKPSLVQRAVADQASQFTRSFGRNAATAIP